MKIIFENWRGYLNEAVEVDPEYQEDVEKAEKCETIGSIIKKVDAAQKAEKDKKDLGRLKGYSWNLAKRLAGILTAVVPVLGGVVQAVDAAEFLKSVRDDLKEKKINWETVADFPVLGTLTVDPELLKIVQHDILDKIDDMYEEEVLRKLNPDVCIDEIPTLNDFIRSKIAKETDQHVVIVDKSGT